MGLSAVFVILVSLFKCSSGLAEQVDDLRWRPSQKAQARRLILEQKGSQGKHIGIRLSSSHSGMQLLACNAWTGL